MNSLLIYVHENLIYVHEIKQGMFKPLSKYASQLRLITIDVLTMFLQIFHYTEIKRYCGIK